MLEEQADELDRLTEENRMLRQSASETLKWKQKASELTSEITWIKKDAKAKLERERSENKNLEKSIKTLRRMLDEREEKIRALTEEIRNTEERVSACRWWLGFLILETALVTYFTEPLSRLPIPLWGVHAGSVFIWFGISFIIRHRFDN
ncbi:MAG: hypothetical protein IKH28_12745 [Lachnospiraceae bacterium]|nr:hypothetical protein [Lachnospiraceae bacterium]